MKFEAIKRRFANIKFISAQVFFNLNFGLQLHSLSVLGVEKKIILEIDWYSCG